LTKHLWEHTPEWSLTSKLLISKHQQVQLLEAASVLLAMNIDQDNTPPSSARDFQSDQEESEASGYSDLRESSRSSADTTPPPQDDQVNRYRSGSSLGFFSVSPSLTAISSGNKEEDEGLANAIDLLSCSFGSLKNKEASLPLDVPPVPPLPAQYASYATQHGLSNGPLALIDERQRADSYAASDRYYAASDRYHSYDDRSQSDVKMEDGDDSIIGDDESERHSRGRSDEDDEGVFGRMEE